MLRQGDRAVHEIAEELPISRPAVRDHLRLLKEAGSWRSRPSGTGTSTTSRTKGSTPSAATSNGLGRGGDEVPSVAENVEEAG